MSQEEGRSSSVPARSRAGLHRVGLLAASLLLVGLCAGVVLVAAPERSVMAAPSAPAELSGGAKLTEGDYVVLAWNDLGMHCYNRSFADLAVLPPWNTLWAQVIKIGDPPQVVTNGLTVEFFLEDNTTSVTKSDFWDAGHSGTQNALWLFGSLMGFSEPLPNDIGLTGTGLSGEMELHGDHFAAEGIPLTEFSDSDLVNAAPYQMATIIVRDAATGDELARTQPVAPVSTEMHCDNCHYDNSPANAGIHTGVIEQNILVLHDNENGDEYPGNLMDRRPILCAECHSSNALGAPGVAGVPSLSNAMHETHNGQVPDSLDGCYNCHPGPETQCLRDVMSTYLEPPEERLDCVDCHGGMSTVSQNPDPWLNEPTCSDTGCHDSGLYGQDQPLYRMSKEHGGVYCAGCHDSPHAIALSREPADAIKFIGWQGYAGTLDNCIVCHTSLPQDAGPHGQLAGDIPFFVFAPDSFGIGEPATQAIYTHTVDNAGNVSDTYQLTWSSTQGWASVVSEPSPLILQPAESGVVTVTITIPGGDVTGLIDRTVVTATSTANAALFATVLDRTLVPRAHIYLPLIMRSY
jgi:hypothetical protein